MNAEDFLNGYAKIDAIIQSKEKKIKDLNDKATDTASHLNPDKVQISGSGQKMANSVDEVLDLIAEIEPLLIARKKLRREIESVIEQLPLLRYKILHRKYILFEEPKAIAREVDRCKDTVNKQLKIAIEEVQRILDVHAEKFVK